MKFGMTHIVIFSIMLLFGVNSIASESFLLRSYSIPENGKLSLNSPLSWKSSFTQPKGGLPPTISIGPADKSIFVRATTFWNVKKLPNFNSPEELKKTAALVSNRLLSRSVETKIDLVELKGIKNRGYYYTITDKKPKPGEYLYMSQGYIGVNDLVLAFTILSHKKMSGAIETALTMLKDAEQTK